MKKIFLFVFFIIFLSLFSISLAQNIPQPQGGEINTSFFNIWEGTGGGGTLTCNTLGYHCTFCDALIVTTNIIKFLLNIGIVLAVVVILYAGIRFITAGGSEQQITNAKDIIKKALIGLALVIGAWFIVSMIFSFLTNRSNWNEVNPLNCPDGKLKVWDLDKNKKTSPENTDEGRSGIDKSLNPWGGKVLAGGTTGGETGEEGNSVPDITTCKITKDEEKNFYAKFIQAVFASQKKGVEGVVEDAGYYFNKKNLIYSNDADKRLDLDGGYADCSGFVYKLYYCNIGVAIGLNTYTQKVGTVPSGVTRYNLENMSNEDIIRIVQPGDSVGYDRDCRNAWHTENKTGKTFKMGHVGIVIGITDGSPLVVHQTSNRGLGPFKEKMNNEWHLGPWRKCGYILHVN